MKRFLLLGLTAIAFPTVVNANNKYPLNQWVLSDLSPKYESRFLGCKRGICQKQLRGRAGTNLNFLKHFNYDCKNFRVIEDLPLMAEIEDYQKYVWTYPRIGSDGEAEFNAVCSHKDGFDFKD